MQFAFFLCVNKRSTFYALSPCISNISFGSPLHSGRCAIGNRQSNGNGQIEFRLHWLDAYLSVIMGPEFNSLLLLSTFHTFRKMCILSLHWKHTTPVIFMIIIVCYSFNVPCFVVRVGVETNCIQLNINTHRLCEKRSL